MATRHRKPSLPLHTFLGLAVLIAAQTLLWFRIEPVTTWFTPIVWWGFILFVDGLNARLGGTSYLTRRRGEFLILTLASIPCWLVFEYYNIYLEAWHYIGIPPSLPVRYTAYTISFASIWPAIFQTAELLDNIGFLKALRGSRVTARPFTHRIMLFSGAFMLAAPFIFPLTLLIPLVWVGFVLFLEPINYRNGSRSLLRLLEKGRPDQVLTLALAGLLCGLLWEFWNYWAAAKWVYTVPFTPTVRYFEMPIIGLLGFIPFAWECFAMFSTVLWTLRREGVRKNEDLVCVYTVLALLLLIPPFIYGDRPPDDIRPTQTAPPAMTPKASPPDLRALNDTLRFGNLEQQLDAIQTLAALDTSEAMRTMAPYLAAEQPVLREQVEDYFRAWSRRHRFQPLEEPAQP